MDGAVERRTVVLAGVTGDGKSSTGNSVCGRAAFATSGGLRSETRAHAVADYRHGGAFWRVIDTIGLEDTCLPQLEVLRRFSLFADDCPDGVDAFLFARSRAGNPPRKCSVSSRETVPAGVPRVRPARDFRRRGRFLVERSFPRKFVESDGSRGTPLVRREIACCLVGRPPFKHRSSSGAASSPSTSGRWTPSRRTSAPRRSRGRSSSSRTAATRTRRASTPRSRPTRRPRRSATSGCRGSAAPSASTTPRAGPRRGSRPRSTRSSRRTAASATRTRRSRPRGSGATPTRRRSARPSRRPSPTGARARGPSSSSASPRRSPPRRPRSKAPCALRPG